jgi:hypothetical protein
VSGKSKRNGNGNGNGNGGSHKTPSPPVFRPGELDDRALLPRRFEQHLENQRLRDDLTINKLKRLAESIDDLRDEIRSLRQGVRKLFAERDGRNGNGNGNGKAGKK